VADVLVRHQDAIITSTHAVQPSHWEKEHRLLGAPADGAFTLELALPLELLRRQVPCGRRP